MRPVHLVARGESLGRLRHSRQWFARKSFTHEATNEVGEGNYVFSDTRPFEGIHVSVAITDRYDRSGVSARCQHDVHQKTPDAAVSVHVGMNVDEEEMPQHDTHSWISPLTSSYVPG